MNNNALVISGSIIVAALLIGAAIIISQGAKPLVKEEQQQRPSAPVAPVTVDLESWPSLGDPNAPVVLVEYSDFACLYCKRLAEDTIPQIKRQFVDAGKVRLVYKDFVVVGGDRAAEAAHCAHEQGKFWEYHDKLFANQFADRSIWGDPEVHRRYARELGLNADALVACFNERRYQQKVLDSTREASANGGRGTPFSLVNSTPISGAQPFSDFVRVIEKELGR